MTANEMVKRHKQQTAAQKITFSQAQTDLSAQLSAVDVDCWGQLTFSMAIPKTSYTRLRCDADRQPYEEDKGSLRERIYMSARKYCETSTSTSFFFSSFSFISNDIHITHITLVSSTMRSYVSLLSFHISTRRRNAITLYGTVAHVTDGAKSASHQNHSTNSLVWVDKCYGRERKSYCKASVYSHLFVLSKFQAPHMDRCFPFHSPLWRVSLLSRVYARFSSAGLYRLALLLAGEIVCWCFRCFSSSSSSSSSLFCLFAVLSSAGASDKSFKLLLPLSERLYGNVMTLLCSYNLLLCNFFFLFH